MKNNVILIGILTILICLSANAQYVFEDDIKLECSEIKNQNRTGTCWSFATSSFLESEAIKKGNQNVDLSEMFVVRNIYKTKALNYVLRQGKANFSQGSLAHDLLNVVDKYGVVPESKYSGKLQPNQEHNHSELEKVLKGFLDGVIASKNVSDRWPIAFDAILDIYLGDYDKSFDAKSHANKLGLSADNYINISSFTHHPFGDSFILEIPDNFSNGSFYNMPIDELVQNIDHALDEGYTIAWDGDVSEKGFDAKQGIAVLPTDEKREDLFEKPGEEMKVNQDKRQEAFMNYRTTDDHLMHIVGTAKDQNDNRYYIIKNSWGPIGPHEGYLYMSEAYLKMKTVAITMNKNAMKSKI